MLNWRLRDCILRDQYMAFVVQRMLPKQWAQESKLPLWAPQPCCIHDHAEVSCLHSLQKWSGWHVFWECIWHWGAIGVHESTQLLFHYGQVNSAHWPNHFAQSEALCYLGSMHGAFVWSPSHLKTCCTFWWDGCRPWIWQNKCPMGLRQQEDRMKQKCSVVSIVLNMGNKGNIQR